MLNQFLKDNSIQNQPEKVIYRYIYTYGSITQTKLTELTKLNRLKVARVLNNLLDQGYIQTSGFANSGGGRPPVLYQINADFYIVGINISRTHCSVGLFDLSLQEVEQGFFLMTKKHTPSVVFTEMTNIINALLNKHSIDKSKLIGIGIGTVGPIDPINGTILDPDPFLSSGWKNVPITSMLKEEFPIDVILMNYANAAVLGVKVRLGYPAENLLYCINGWNIGCGAIIEGNLLNSWSGDVNGFGHMVIDANGPACTCGNRGCVQAYSSLRAIINDISKTNISDSILTNEDTTIDDVMKFLIHEQENVHDIVMKSAHYCGVGIANIVNTLQIKKVIISGNLIQDYPGYFNKAVESAKQHIYIKNSTDFYPEQKNSDSALIGSAMKVLDHYSLNKVSF